MPSARTARALGSRRPALIRPFTAPHGSAPRSSARCHGMPGSGSGDDHARERDGTAGHPGHRHRPTPRGGQDRPIWVGLASRRLVRRALTPNKGRLRVHGDKRLSPCQQSLRARIAPVTGCSALHIYTSPQCPEMRAHRRDEGRRITVCLMAGRYGDGNVRAARQGIVDALGIGPSGGY